MLKLYLRFRKPCERSVPTIPAVRGGHPISGGDHPLTFVYPDFDCSHLRTFQPFSPSSCPGTDGSVSEMIAGPWLDSFRSPQRKTS